MVIYACKRGKPTGIFPEIVFKYWPNIAQCSWNFSHNIETSIILTTVVSYSEDGL